MPKGKLARMALPTQQYTPRTDWFKSSYSTSTGTCVETRLVHDQVGVRDSKRLHIMYEPVDETTLSFTERQWAALLNQLRT